ncbi:DUF2817 domain-containing protein [Euzebyella marina]|uniref:DUF2817 domain-containing protein n=1 Tax=Euzebyella marina TaxID=1761453 RepID=A0A3G2L6V0_9FLAO|nr:M14 metallopeptidase family protein [Euzebyella marina]AYN68004.1 DUF2817 domain-containing protein [Euzebyella marina]
MISNELYEKIKEQSITGRYVVHGQIQEVLNNLPSSYKIEHVGSSVLGKSINAVKIGTGKEKVFMWSQMHGNESTTTKAVCDLFNFLVSDDVLAKSILNHCTLMIIPMLNPDGAEAYTRVNTNEVDLNRDAQDRSQPESNVLRDVFERFEPDFCFNLHDQRTIFNVGESNKPATVSFLAPAHDEERSISPSRAISMKLIVAMNEMLQGIIPNRIGRYDDSFNANCVGDTFQMLNTPTILFESGHSPNDYMREQTREYIFLSLLKALNVIAESKVENFSIEKYNLIPENSKHFVDILLINADGLKENNSSKITIPVQFKETLINGSLEFVPEYYNPEDTEIKYGHLTIDCSLDSDLQELKAKEYYPLIDKIFQTLS